MNSESTISMHELRFRPRGVGRFGAAGFLCVWLCGWLVGEVFALVMIGAGLYALLTGQPPPGSDNPLNPGAALGIGAFLLAWLTFWTIGGIAAIQEVLRLLWAEDKLQIDPNGLARVHRRGPFVSRQQWQRQAIQRVYVQQTGKGQGKLMAHVDTGIVDLTDLGTTEERDDGARLLQEALGHSPHTPLDEAAALPSDWEEITTSLGERLLVPNRHTRRKQAWAVSVIAILAWTGTVCLAWISLKDPNAWVLTIMVGVGATWLAGAAHRMHQGRKEWRLEPGRIIHQQRRGLRVTELLEAHEVELTESTDSDGDRWYELNAIPNDLRAGVPTDKPAKKVRLHRTIHDPTEPRCLGIWLSHTASIPFHDRVPTEDDRQAQFERMRDQLASTGKVGAFAARLLDKANASRRRR